MVTYNIVMGICGSLNFPEKARQLFEEMEGASDGGTTPDIISYNTLIKAWAKAGRWKEAVKLLEGMSGGGAAAATSAGGAGGESTNENAAGGAGEQANEDGTIAASAGADGANADGADADANVGGLNEGGPSAPPKGSKKPSPNVITYMTVIEACKSAGKGEKALEVLRRFEKYPVFSMKGTGTTAILLKPDKAMYNSVVSALANSGDCAKVFA